MLIIQRSSPSNVNFSSPAAPGGVAQSETQGVQGAVKSRRAVRRALEGPASQRVVGDIHQVGVNDVGKYHGKWGFEAFTNMRGAMYHSAKNDPGLRYPPYSQHTSERKIESRLTP